MKRQDWIDLIKQKDYLGDGLYVRHDGYNIVLSTKREDGEHFVALEPEVLQAFDRYRDRINKLIENLKECKE